MIVLTKEKLKFTFESEVGSKFVTMTMYANGVGLSDAYIEKDYAFDIIQVMIKNGYKQGE